MGEVYRKEGFGMEDEIRLGDVVRTKKPHPKQRGGPQPPLHKNYASLKSFR